MALGIFVGSLVAVMLLGMPIAFALLASDVALMFFLDMFDTQIIAPVIPPSIPMIMFGVTGGVSITKAIHGWNCSGFNHGIRSCPCMVADHW